MSIIVLCLLLFSLFFFFYFWKKRKLYSLVSITPLIVVAIFVGYVIFHTVYEVTPKDLEFTSTIDKNESIIKGNWDKKLDAYKFSTDFLVVFTPVDSEKISIKRERTKEIKEEDLLYLKEEVIKSVEDIHPGNAGVQIFDIRTDNQFTFKILFPQGLDRSNTKIYYIHAREEPMETLEFWHKEITL